MSNTYGFDEIPPMRECIVIIPDGLDAKLDEIASAITRRADIEVEYIDGSRRHMFRFCPQSIQQTSDEELFINGYVLNDDTLVAYLRTETNGLIVHMNR